MVVAGGGNQQSTHNKSHKDNRVVLTPASAAHTLRIRSSAVAINPLRGGKRREGRGGEDARAPA